MNPQNNPTNEPVPKASWLMYAAIPMSLGLITLFNVFFFSTTVLLTSIVLLGWMAYSHIKQRASNTCTHDAPLCPNQKEKETSSDKLAAPILILVSTQKAHSPEHTQAEPEDAQLNNANKPIDLAGYRLHGLFSPPAEHNTELANQEDQAHLTTRTQSC